MVVAPARPRRGDDAAASLHPSRQREAGEAFELGLTREQGLRLFNDVLDERGREPP